jgi:hypothetical protein
MIEANEEEIKNVFTSSTIKNFQTKQSKIALLTKACDAGPSFLVSVPQAKRNELSRMIPTLGIITKKRTDTALLGEFIYNIAIFLKDNPSSTLTRSTDVSALTSEFSSWMKQATQLADIWKSQAVHHEKQAKDALVLARAGIAPVDKRKLPMPSLTGNVQRNLNYDIGKIPVKEECQRCIVCHHNSINVVSVVSLYRAHRGAIYATNLLF